MQASLHKTFQVYLDQKWKGKTDKSRPTAEQVFSMDYVLEKISHHHYKPDPQKLFELHYGNATWETN